jgi:hypothetical protein
MKCPQSFTAAGLAKWPLLIGGNTDYLTILKSFFMISYFHKIAALESDLVFINPTTNR